MHKIIAALIGIGCLPLDYLISKLPFKPSGKTAIIRMDQLGDFLLCRGFLKGIIDQTPEIILIVNSSVAPIAQHCFPNVEIVSVDLKRYRVNIKYRLQTLLSIRKLRLSRMIHPVYSRHHFVVDADSMIRGSGAVDHIGFLGETLTGTQKMVSLISINTYTQLVHTQQDHDSTKYDDLAKYLGIHTAPLFQLHAPPSRMTLPDRYAVIFPVANSRQRQWPIHEWINTLTEISKSNLKIMMCGDRENEITRTIMSHFPNIISMVGKTSISDLTSLLAKAEWVCGVDGGGIHIAAAVHTRTLVIAGGGQWGRFIPYPSTISGGQLVTINHPMPCYGCRWKCIYKSSEIPCLSQLSHQSVTPTLLDWSHS